MGKTPEEQKAYHREWYLKNRERILARSKEYHADPVNKERDRKVRAKYRAENKDKVRKQLRELKLRRDYGITYDRYTEILHAQNACCAACLLPANGEVLCVDHDHDTGEVRGLLHRTCNLLVGQIENHVGSIRNVVNYIDETTNWRKRRELAQKKEAHLDPK